MSDAMDKLAEGERLLAALHNDGGLGWRKDSEVAMRQWLFANADALLAGMRALVEIDDVHKPFNAMEGVEDFQAWRNKMRDWELRKQAAFEAAKEAISRFKE